MPGFTIRLAYLAIVIASVSALALAGPAEAVLLATATGTENAGAPTGPPGPTSDPGWLNVGRSDNGLGIVYIGDGWVLTAAHVLFANVTFVQPIGIAPVTASLVQLENSPGVNADLKMWRILSDPGLPPLVWSSAPPPHPPPPFTTSDVMMMGYGRARGASTIWMGFQGWEWIPGGGIKRWGTNQIESAPSNIVVGGRTTRSFGVDFTVTGLKTDFEAVGTTGDSGGAVFYHDGSDWELTGIMVAVGAYGGQPSSTSLDGNITYFADLSHFDAQIAATVTELACSDGTDDDGDGLVDYPDDPGCSSASDPFETEASLPCDDGFDDDGDGLRDMLDPGCADPLWFTESPACDDGLDNDGDGRTDFDPVTAASPGDTGTPPAGSGDPGCFAAWAASERPACQDGIDNDGDGGIDYDGGRSVNGSPTPGGADSRCTAPSNRESQLVGPSCGLGFELVGLVPLLARLRRRRR